MCDSLIKVNHYASLWKATVAPLILGFTNALSVTINIGTVLQM